MPTALNTLAMMENPPFLRRNKDLFNYIKEYMGKLRDYCYCLPLKLSSDQINLLPVRSTLGSKSTHLGYIAQPLCQFLYECATQKISLPMMNWKEWEALSNNDAGGMIKKGGGRGRETKSVDDAFKAAITEGNEDFFDIWRWKIVKREIKQWCNAKHVDLESTNEEKNASRLPAMRLLDFLCTEKIHLLEKNLQKKDNEVKKEEDDNQPKKSLNIHIQALNAAIGKLKPPGYKEQFLSTFTRKVEDYLKQLTECSLPENAMINLQNEADNLIMSFLDDSFKTTPEIAASRICAFLSVCGEKEVILPVPTLEQWWALSHTTKLGDSSQIKQIDQRFKGCLGKGSSKAWGLIDTDIIAPYQRKLGIRWRNAPLGQALRMLSLIAKQQAKERKPLDQTTVQMRVYKEHSSPIFFKEKRTNDLEPSYQTIDRRPSN
ncbi:hypothetical protein [Coxiella burnetii]|uniref:hypothetical protein n=1 Tax=Coxiella burnetii TaxID=777 RepID=UPI001E613C69|nr:hypothetical protein [Coxiella burnetii]